MKINVLLFFIFSYFTTWSQDTISIYFDFGSSKVKVFNLDILSKIPAKYDVSDIDSVHFIGYTDSIGKIKANIKLSQKRAQNVFKICETTFKNKPFSIYAKGEIASKNDSLNRRVDVILYQTKVVPEVVVEKIEEVNWKCFFVDIQAMENCNIRTIKKKGKEYVYIEALNIPDFKNSNHFYISTENRNKKKVQKLNWKLKKTGKLWWSKQRYTATIPKEGFDQFRFFKLSDSPCNGCGDTLFKKDTIIFNNKARIADVFLMENTQMKRHLFLNKPILIRVPKEYVDTSITYYYNAGKEFEIEWETKNRKNQSDYYFASLLENERYPFFSITKEITTTDCSKPYIKSDIKIPCGGCRHIPSNVKEFKIILEPGVFYMNDSLTAYLSFGISLNKYRTIASLHFGINSNLGFYSFAKIDYYFHSFLFQKRTSQWTAINQKPEKKDAFGAMYIGVELKTSFNKTYLSFIEGNTHLGIAYIRRKEEDFLSRIYLHGGVGYDFTKRVNSSIYPIIQAGVVFNLRSISLR